MHSFCKEPTKSRYLNGEDVFVRNAKFQIPLIKRVEEKMMSVLYSYYRLILLNVQTRMRLI